MGQRNRQIVIDELPQGRLGPQHFRLREADCPAPGEGEVLVRVRYISLDAANRAWMQGATYRSALGAGQVMSGGGVAEVLESRSPGLKPGDLVFADTGWQELAVLPGANLSPLPDLRPMTHLISVYGVAGLTAYFGLIECGQPKAGETLVVSAAAGSVGSLVGQIGKILGCRVVGIAGGEAKSRWIVDELGFDAGIDYKAGDLRAQLAASCPGGIDVYFDNVGGPILETCLFAMNNFGRVACCGAVSQYDGASPQHGPRGVPGLIVTRRLTMRGFIVTDYDARRDEALSQLQDWVASGRLRVHEEVLEGLESLPAGLVGLLGGDNLGKRMVKIG